MKGGPERIGARWDVDDTAERMLVRAAGLVTIPAAWNIPGTATAATEGRLLTIAGIGTHLARAEVGTHTAEGEIKVKAGEGGARPRKRPRPSVTMIGVSGAGRKEGTGQRPPFPPKLTDSPWAWE